MKLRAQSAVLAVAMLAAGGSTSLLSGCAATTVAISKHTLDVQTKMSDTIFLDPVAAAQRSIFVQVRNTSDKQDFDIAADVKAAIAAKGYRVVDDPDRAQFILQANILQVGKVSQTAAQMGFGGYGAPIAGVVAGAGAAMALGSVHAAPIAGVGLLGGAVELIANAAVKDVYYAVTTDVQLKERQHQGVKSTENSVHNLHQGNSGGTTVSYAQTSDYRTYQTRVTSIANKVNLDFQDAAQPLREGLVRVISGVF